MHRPSCLLASLLVLGACSNPSRPDYVVHLVTALGRDPFMTDCTSGAIRVDVRQGTNHVLTSNATITGGVLGDLAVTIPSYGTVTQIAVTVTCGDGSQRVGATPPFVPAGYGFVDVVLGEPGTCDGLSAPSLTQPLVSPSLVRLGANVVVVGGVASDGMPSSTLRVLDPVQLTYASATPLSFTIPSGVGIGRGTALALDDTRIAFVSDSRSGIFDTAFQAVADEIVDAHVHAGAGSASAVVSYGSGVAVIGGLDGGDPSGEITWIPAGAGSPHGAHLATPRAHPSAVVLAGGGRLLIAGGQAAGQPLFEVISVDGDDAVAFGPTDETRFEPLVVTDQAHARILVTGGTTSIDDASPVRTTSHVLSACNGSGCTIAAGDPFPTPRVHAAIVPRTVGEGLVGVYEALIAGGAEPETLTASKHVDRVRIGADGSVSFLPLGDLQSARATAGATEIGAGVVMIGGGTGTDGQPLGSIELCFPTALAPL